MSGAERGEERREAGAQRDRRRLAETLFNEGNRALAEGNTAAAVEAFEAGASLAPHLAALWQNWAAALFDSGDAAAAEQITRRGLAACPSSKELTLSLLELLSRRGDQSGALELLESTLARHPADLDLRYEYARRLPEPQRYRALSALTEEAPHFAPPWRKLANALLMNGQLKAIETLLIGQPVLEREPWLLNILACALQNAGQIEAALQRFDQALAIEREPSIESNALLCANYPSSISAAELADRHRAWGDAHQPRDVTPPPLSPPRERIRVGYLSGDFRTHSVAYFFETLLIGHDRHRVEILCCDTRPSPKDPIGARLRSYGDRWLDLSGLDDLALARRLRAEELDLLVELHGHSGGNRLLACAQRPAPLLATAMGYPHSTGLELFDFRITDAIADPPGAERDYREHLARIPGGFLAYRPPDEAPPPASTPAWKRKGHFTFGSFNQLSKISEETLTLWAAILHGAPEAQLLLKARPLADPDVVAHWEGRFAEYGIDPTRLTLRGRVPDKGGHLSLYHEVDLALDPTPYNGTTTTLEALWMGVPVLALRGDRHGARVSASLLHHAGLSEWIAEDPAGYVATALRAAETPEILLSNEELRARFAASPLLDARRYAREVERVYFARWAARSERKNNQR